MNALFRDHDILMVPGAYDALSARIIEQSGCPLVYLGGLANEASDLGYPDLGLTTASELVRRAANIRRVVEAPMMCDADTGFGGAVNVIRTVREFEAAVARVDRSKPIPILLRRGEMATYLLIRPAPR